MLRDGQAQQFEMDGSPGKNRMGDDRDSGRRKEGGFYVWRRKIPCITDD